jgi:hypothetical protein
MVFGAVWHPVRAKLASNASAAALIKAEVMATGLI